VHYVTDYSALDYEVVDEEGSLYVTAHLAAEGFVDGDRTTLVVDSDAQGAMGPSLVPFTSSEDAEEFQAEYGGDLVDFDDVDPELLGAL
ncbi:MAG: nitrous oxide reductase accessory protein NosL, partial [Halobacteriota archaeon]